jgi:hypothetical protein
VGECRLPPIATTNAMAAGLQVIGNARDHDWVLHTSAMSGWPIEMTRRAWTRIHRWPDESPPLIYVGIDGNREDRH